MKLDYYLLISIFTVLFVSCDSSSEYTDEELQTLQEAQRVHNEAMAIFSQSRSLLAELTEVRANIARVAQIDVSDTSNIMEQDSMSGNLPDTSKVVKADTMQLPKLKKALTTLNEAQANLLEWMRDIYQVPEYPDIYEDEKAGEDPGIGMDFDSNMLLTDMEFKDYPEDTSPDEILESQKKMKESIMKIKIKMEEAIEDGRNAYIYRN